jgi:hypothetical protein
MERVIHAQPQLNEFNYQSIPHDLEGFITSVLLYPKKSYPCTSF